MADPEAPEAAADGLASIKVSSDNANTVLEAVSAQVATLQARAITHEELAKTRRELQQLSDMFEHGVKVQTQKDEAQDTLLEMQFDSLKRELATYIRSSDLEDQKAFLLSKLSNIELEMRDAMRSMGASLREEINSDAKKLQEQMESIAAAVTSQIKLVDDRLHANADSDEKFQQLMLSRLARVEGELGLDENGRPVGGAGLVQRVVKLEERCEGLADMTSGPAARRAGTPGQQGLDGDAEEGRFSDIESRLAALEESIKALGLKDDEIEENIEVVKKEVEEVKRSGKLDWLEERVRALADKKAASERPDIGKVANTVRELGSRVESLEQAQESMMLEGESTVKVGAEEETEEDDDVGGPGSRASSPKSRGGTRGGTGLSSTAVVGDPSLSYVNLFEDMERLRCIIECMEESMPLEVRKAISFFKRGRNRGGEKENDGKPSSPSRRGNTAKSDAKRRGSSPPPPMELEAEVLGLRSETEEQAQRVQRVEEMLENERVNLHKALRSCEREQDHMKQKVDDLWRKLPQVSAILAPLQVHLLDNPSHTQEGGSENTDAVNPSEVKVRADVAIEALKPLGGLIEAALQKSINKLRDDLIQEVSEVKGEVGLKASSIDLTLLKDRVERWVHAPSPKQAPTLASYKGKALQSLGDSGEGWQTRSLERSKSGATCHERCKAATTCPCSQSTGKLPSLSKKG
mmetsp:Transcript_24318/g.61671  ORF Transcript_24318/g.61671 Transcript_24318/m.61671 type:complete len:694 (+) Transcript_24318:127-2208(+)